jgi:hypothetical protein
MIFDPRTDNVQHCPTDSCSTVVRFLFKCKRSIIQVNLIFCWRVWFGVKNASDNRQESTTSRQSTGTTSLTNPIGNILPSAKQILMPALKDPEIQLLIQQLESKELSPRLSYTQVLDQFPLVKLRFNSDENYKTCFKNYWNNLKKKYINKGLLGVDGEDWGEPTPPEPDDFN